MRIGVVKAYALGLALTCAACAGATTDDGRSDATAAGDGGGHADGGPAQDAPPFFGDAAVDDGGAPADAGAPADSAPTCYPDTDETAGNETCITAAVKASLADVSSTHVSIIANLWPEGDVDWYRVAFVDSADTPGVCDPFNIGIALAQNPGDRYRFDVVLDDCTAAPTCDAGEQATGLTTFSYSDAFACPCIVPSGDPPNTVDNVHVCIDHSMTLRIRVFRVAGAPALCENYELAIDNG